MSTIELELEEELTSVLESNQRPLQQTLRELVVLESYRRRAISSGRAAVLLGMPREEFIRHASELGIPFLDMSPDDWEAECARIEGL